MPLTREQTKYLSTQNTVFLPTVAVDGRLGVTGNSVFNASVTFNDGITVNKSASIFGGIINQGALINGVHAGLGGDLSPRIMFVPANQTTSVNNWQIDVLGGRFRWFTPGIEQMAITSTKNLLVPQALPVTTLVANSTLTVEQIQSQIILATNSALNLTLPTGALMNAAGFGSLALDWSIINTIANIVTLNVNTSHTFTGNANIAAQSSASFRTINNAGTWNTFRMS